MNNTRRTPERSQRSLFGAAAGGVLLTGTMVVICGQPFGNPTSRAADSAPVGFKPVPLPDPKIPGFNFPETEANIVQWTQQNNQKAIDLHGWGVWAALTLSSGQQYEGQNLSVFETWFTPEDILTARLMKARALGDVSRNPLPLRGLRQFRVLNRDKTALGEPTVLGFVKFDPTSADFIANQNLLSKSTLKGLLQSGKTDVPDFPNTSISLKPVYQVLAQSKLVGGRYFMLADWPGPPNPPRAFPSSEWKQCVWVDVQDAGLGKGNGKVDTVCKADGSSRTDETTYGLGRFINFRMSAAQALMADALHEQVRGNAAPVSVAGNYAVLVAMHVTTREMTRWTWQTFWWSPNPDSPPQPSSPTTAAARPAALKDAPRSYAMSTAYMMETPPQPNTGGTNAGNSVYGYNPWLEARFGPSVLPASTPGTLNGQQVANNVGVQTNCMSCHAQASYSSAGADLESTLYTGNRYIELKGPQFKGNLRTYFLWSIPDTAR
jgi:hypothetical protein